MDEPARNHNNGPPLDDDEGPEWLDERGFAGRFVDLAGVVLTNRTWTSSVPLEAAA